jgi:hypothetical protein
MEFIVHRIPVICQHNKIAYGPTYYFIYKYTHNYRISSGKQTLATEHIQFIDDFPIQQLRRSPSHNGGGLFQHK